MKKISKILILLLLLGLFYQVKADVGPPIVAEFEVYVSNKDGAYCYEWSMDDEYKYVKSNRYIPFGEVFKVVDDVRDDYITTYSDTYYECVFKASDISVKKDSFSVNNDGVVKIDKVNGIILATSGLNMRKGPSTKYSIVTTIPVGKMITITHSAGTYWYYAEYNGKKGWISGRNATFGYDDSEVLYSSGNISIYDKNAKIIGEIPAFTEITDYIRLIDYQGYGYYVIYNGIKGYVYHMDRKVDGKLKLEKNLNVYDDDNKIKQGVSKGEVLNYSIYIYGSIGCEYDIVYIPSLKGFLHVTDGDISYLGETVLKKTSGYIKDGTFDLNKNDITTDIPQDDEKNNESNNIFSQREIILISILGGVILALTAIIVILLVNSSKKENNKEKVLDIDNTLGKDNNEVEKNDNVDNKEEIKSQQKQDVKPKKKKELQ